MSRSTLRLTGVAVAAVGAMAVGGTALAAPGGSTGPSSSDAPYLVRHVPGVTLTSLLTSGDSVGGYRMAGTPDGLGAYDNGDGTFTVLVNHEFGAATSVARSHGNTSGAFVSRWVVDSTTLEVLSGRDQITSLVTTGSLNIDRLCSADLAPISAWYNTAIRAGVRRAALHQRRGVGTERARLRSRRRHRGQLRADRNRQGRLGERRRQPVDRRPHRRHRPERRRHPERLRVCRDQAGDRLTDRAGRPDQRGAQDRLRLRLPDRERRRGVPRHPAALHPRSHRHRLRPARGWCLGPDQPERLLLRHHGEHDQAQPAVEAQLQDATRPELGGTITKVLEGPADDTPASVGPKMMDNLTVDSRGQVLIQEDPGGNAYLAGIYQFDPASGALRRIADHDPQRFVSGGSAFDTIDEESSGIIPVPFLGAGKYLVADQNHAKVADPAQVEKGQLLLLNVPPGQPVR